jgi:predicted transcriptional regulator
MASKTSTNAERTARRAQVWQLRTQEGLSQAAIAEIVGVAQTTVCRDLDFVANQVAADLTAVAKREKVIQVHQLQAIVREALQAWQKSKKPYKEIKRETINELQEVPIDDGEVPIEDGEESSLFPSPKQTEKKMVTVSEKVLSKFTEKVGNTIYLRTALEAMTDLRDLLGLEEPKTVNFNWQKELEDQGLDPALVFENMVQAAFDELENEGPIEGDE